MAFNTVPVPEVFTKKLDAIENNNGTFAEKYNPEAMHPIRLGLSMAGTFLSMILFGIPWYFSIPIGLSLAAAFTGVLWLSWKIPSLNQSATEALDPYEGIPKEIVEWYNDGGASKNFSARPYTEWDEMFSRAKIRSIKTNRR